MKGKIKTCVIFVFLIILCISLVGCKDNYSMNDYRLSRKAELQLYANNILKNNIFSFEDIQLFDKYLTEGLEKIDSANKKSINKIIEQTKVDLKSIPKQMCTQIATDVFFVIYHEESNFKKEFIEKNSTYGVGHVKEEWNKENSNANSIPSEFIKYDVISPQCRAHLITSQDELDEIFKMSPKIDFENEIVFVICFSRHANRSENIKMIFNNSTMQVFIEEGSPLDGFYNTAVWQMSYVYKTNKIDLTSIEIEMKTY